MANFLANKSAWSYTRIKGLNCEKKEVLDKQRNVCLQEA